MFLKKGHPRGATGRYSTRDDAGGHEGKKCIGVMSIKTSMQPPLYTSLSEGPCWFNGVLGSGLAASQFRPWWLRV